MQLTDEDAVVVAKFYFSPAVLPNLSVTKVRQACLIEDIAFSKKLKLSDLLVVFGKSLVNNKSETWKTSSFNQGRHSATVTYKHLAMQH